MLPKKNRFTTAAFTTLFQTGRRVHTPCFQIILGSEKGFRGAVVVGKKVYRRAVDRNRLRRQLYAGLRTWQESTGYDHPVIVVVKPKLTTFPIKERTMCLHEALEKLHT